MLENLIPFGLPGRPALMALAPVVAWAVERACAGIEGGDPSPVATGRWAWLGTLVAALAIALAAAIQPDDPAPAALLGWGLLALARIDLAHGLLPDRLTVPLAGAGLALSWLDATIALGAG